MEKFAPKLEKYPAPPGSEVPLERRSSVMPSANSFNAKGDESTSSISNLSSVTASDTSREPVDDTPLLELSLTERKTTKRGAQSVAEKAKGAKPRSSQILPETSFDLTDLSTVKKTAFIERDHERKERNLGRRLSRSASRSFESGNPQSQFDKARRLIRSINQRWVYIHQLSEEGSHEMRADEVRGLLDTHLELFKQLDDLDEDYDGRVVQRLSLEKVFETASTLQSEECLDDTIKAKFLTALVVQFNRFKERQKRLAFSGSVQS